MVCASCDVFKSLEKNIYGMKIYEMKCSHSNNKSKKEIGFSLMHTFITINMWIYAAFAFTYYLRKLLTEEFKKIDDIYIICSHVYLAFLEVVMPILVTIKNKTRFICEQLTAVLIENESILQTVYVTNNLLLSWKSLTLKLSFILFSIPVCTLTLNAADLIFMQKVISFEQIFNSVVCSVATYIILSIILHCELYIVIYKDLLNVGISFLIQTMNKRKNCKVSDNFFNYLCEKRMKEVARLYLSSIIIKDTFANYISPVVIAAVALLPIFLTIIITHFTNIILFSGTLPMDYIISNIILLSTLLSIILSLFFILVRVEGLHEPVS